MSILRLRVSIRLVLSPFFPFFLPTQHLFNEWSTKHETENSKQEEEMFVQCIQSSRGNAMDHLQRRNSHSAGGHRGFESSGVFAKKVIFEINF